MFTAVNDQNLKISSPTSATDDVFIVEDEPVARRALQYLMSSRGYRVSAFASAEEAISATRLFGIPRIMVVDLNLPGMNGIEFIRVIERSTAAVFLVLITGAGAEELDRLRGKHSVMVMTKPLDFGRLMLLIDNRSAIN